jgi:hypothetical protein
MPGSEVSSGAGKSPRPVMQKGIFNARAETRMEMVGAAPCIGEKRKGGREEFRHLSLHPKAYFYPLLHCLPKF